jgi:hypothetical protein
VVGTCKLDYVLTSVQYKRDRAVKIILKPGMRKTSEGHSNTHCQAIGGYLSPLWDVTTEPCNRSAYSPHISISQRSGDSFEKEKINLKQLGVKNQHQLVLGSERKVNMVVAKRRVRPFAR